MIVYQVANEITGRFYIGKTTKTLQRRRQEHYNDVALGRMTYFHKALAKYPKHAFQWIMLDSAKSLSELNDLERFWIALLRRAGHLLYNMTDGGDGGGRPGKDSQNYGREMPEAQRQKIAESLREYYRDKPGTMTGKGGKLAPFYGRHHTKETRKKIARAKRGVPRPDILGSKNPSAQQVRCTTTGEKFDTATEAANEYGLDLSSIIKCCRGKQKKCGGMEFRYDN